MMDGAPAASPRLRSGIVVAAGTALSRLSGMLRVVVIGVIFGGGPLADAYTTANNAPNAVYELLLGGVLSATLVPLFTDLRTRKDAEGRNAVISVAVVAFVVVAVLAVLAAPYIFRLFSLLTDEAVDAETFRTAGTLLARMLLVQVFFYGLTAIAVAVLNSQRRFFAAAWSPVLANVVTVAALLTLPTAPDGGWTLIDIIDDQRLRVTLGLGATVGIATMAVATSVAASRSELSFRWNFTPRHPAVRRLAGLSGWTFGYVAANQAALIVVQNLTEPGSGGRYAYAQAFTFFVLPHGLLAVSIATTFAPELAAAISARRRSDFNRQIDLGVRMTAMLTLPSGLGILALQGAIAGTFLRHGELGAEQAALAARTLGAFAVGLVGFSVYLFVLRGFYAHLDTRTAFVVNAIECVLNVVLALLLVGRFGVPGLAASFGIAYLLSAVLALSVLAQKSRGLDLRPIARSVARFALASILMAEAVWVTTRFVGSDVGVGALTRLTVGVLVGVAVYIAVLLALRAPELEVLVRRLRSTRSPSDDLDDAREVTPS